MPALRVCMCVLLLFNSQSSAAAGQTPSDASNQNPAKKQKPQKSVKKQDPNPESAPIDTKTREQKAAAFQGRLAKIFDPSNVDLSDYVPCHFTVSELLQLRATPPTPRLTGQEAEALKQQVEAEALAQAEAGSLDSESKADFVTMVAKADLEGLTPSAALAKIIALFRAADKAGAARRNPASIITLYASNPLQGLAVLASVAPDWGPIGEGWAAAVSRQAYDLGVKAGRRQGLTKDQADEVFNSFQTAEFLKELAALSPKEALQKINDESKRILDKETEEVATLQEQATKLDPSTTAAAVEKATKANNEAKAAVDAANEALKTVAQTESVAKENLAMAQNELHLAESALGNVGNDPAKIQLFSLNKQKASEAVVRAESAVNAAHEQSQAAQLKLQESENAQAASAKAQEKAQQQAADAAKVPQDLKTAKESQATATDTKKTIAAVSQPPAAGVSAQAIADSARSTIGAFKRPPDIGCAMSILSWNETRYEYGRLLANEYIGIQVVVRNLSETQEFVMHDSAFAVDTDLTGRKGRFFSGRDKLIVRGMSAADADFSPRNLVVHMLESVGTIMSAVIPIAGTAFSDASSVYNSGFLQGLHKTWADHNTDHLNLLNDTAFSSATAYKTVVPKSGSVMFVMFVPAKQFEQGWWTQPCAEAISNGILVNSPDPDGSDAKNKRQDGEATNDESPSPSKRTNVEDQVGIDLERARAACKLGGGESDENSMPDSNNPSNLRPGVTHFKTIHYKNWSGNALATFRELAFTIVSGVHVNEASQNIPSTSDVGCVEDQQGNVDFNQQSGGILTCPVKGQNLDKVQKLRLRNSTDPGDSKVAEGDVKVNGDSTSATVSFPLSQIGPLEGAAYKVFLVNKDSVESPGGPTLHFARTPFVAPPAPNPITIDLGKDLDPKTLQETITLSGYHLDKVASVTLTSESPTLKLEFTVDKPSAGSATFIFDATKYKSDLTKVSATAKLKLVFTLSDKGSTTVPSQTEVDISGTLTTSTPTPAPATPPPAANQPTGNKASTPGAAGSAPGGTTPQPDSKAQTKPKKTT